MRILHLTLKKKWFDMILSGEKKEEYRKITPYWTQRLFRHIGSNKLSNHDAQRVCDFILKNGYTTAYVQPRQFDKAIGHDGYTNKTFTKEFFCVEVGIGKPEWGAPPEPVFIIKLGKIIETKNC